MRDRIGNRELRIKSCRRQFRKLRRSLTALRERREERDIQRVRQPEHVRDQAIMVVDVHIELLDHRRRKQIFGGACRLRHAHVDKNHVASRQESRVRSVHWMQRRHATATRRELLESRSQRRLKGTDVEYQARRR